MTGGKLVLIGGGVLLILGALIGGIVYATKGSGEPDLTPMQRALRILKQMPIIDGHNDFPWNLRDFVFNDLTKVNFNSNLNATEPWASSPSSHTDLPRLLAGHVGAQFWVAYTRCSSQYKDSVEQTIEQIDVIKRLVKQYADHLQFATSATEIEQAIASGKIASLIGVESGHAIESSFGVLRMYYELGVRYMTLTHGCNTPWADSSPVDAPNATIFPQNNGLSEFGIEIVHEMNRLGMMVDLSHVSHATMTAALNNSKAPIIFSHSSAYALCNHHRNVKDDVLRLIKEKNSLIMVNVAADFVNCEDPANATIHDVMNHIDYIRNITGPDHVGIGADFDGIEMVPHGFEDVSKYPYLIEALIETGRWTDSDLEKLAGRNLLRVLRDVEKVRDSLQSLDSRQRILTRKEREDKGANLSCITAKLPGDAAASASRRKRWISDDFQEL